MALEYYNKLPFQQQKKAMALFTRLADTGIIRNIEKFRHEDDQIYAFKPSPDRFLCFFFKGRKVIITNAFEKQCQKLPRNEKERALFYREDYILRVSEGSYYEER